MKVKYGYRQRLFAITGLVVGLVGPLLVGLIAGKQSWGVAIAVFVVYVVLVIPFALFLWYATRKLRCPECGSEDARLVYDANGAEYVTCEACGIRRATGYSQANF
jgi:hypothetical protein